MRSSLVLGLACFASLLSVSSANAQVPVGSAFTYQGELRQNGNPLNGLADLQFRLYDAAVGGAQVGPIVQMFGTNVSSGHIVADLDFGAAAFSADARWVEIDVRAPAGAGAFTTLAPRQRITPAPVALYTVNGVPGSPGADGAPGAPGQDGAPGTPGQDGADGADGVNGQDGADGAPGPQGPTGASPFVLNGSNTYYDQGNVSIGTTAVDPDMRLWVNGRVRQSSFAVTGSAGPNISWAGLGTDGDWFIRSASSAGKVILQDSGGNVGIGTSTPSAKLDVAGGIKASSLDSGYTRVTEIEVKDTSKGPNASHIVHQSTGNWFIRSASSSGVVILQDTGGSVGIATAPDPAYKLHVKGNGQGHGVRLDDPSKGPNVTALLHGTNGDHYLRSASSSGKVILQDSGGNVGIGTTSPSAKLDVAGTVRGHIIEITGGADIVEGFDSTETLEPGTVVVIDRHHAGDLIGSSEAYDRKVAGVVSGANGVAAGLKLGQDGVLDGEVLVAMSGRVYVKASAENGAIRPGDRLTTASLAGHAMKATDSDRCDGAVIGKAMSTLDDGTGLVLVLVNLQ